MSTLVPEKLAPADPYPGYQLVTKLGQGGMARVLLMLSHSRSRANKLLVVKELLPSLADDPDLRSMFLDEGRLAVRLNHPNVVQTYEASNDAERPLIVMEYLEGQSLSALLNRVGRSTMAIDLHVFILTQALIGLHHAHDLCEFDGTPLNVVHRDVSPQNVFVTYDGQVKVLDFGIAKTTDSDNKTATGLFKGKMSYASPEQIERSVLDRRCDVFAMGVMLWEALARKRISTNDDMSAMSRRLNGQDPRLGEVAPESPEELVRICEKAMAMEPDARFSTAEEFRAALSAYLETSKRVGTHELGALVRSAFAAERAKIRLLVDARMKEIGSAKAALPEVSSGDAQGDSSALRTPSRMAMASEPEHVDTNVVGRLRAMGMGGRLLLGGIVLSAAALVLISFTQRSSGGTSVAADARPLVTAPAELPDAAARTTVDVTVSAGPPEARVFLDGVEMSTNPFHGELPRSTEAHRVRAEAPGFVAEERLAVFDRNIELQMQLRPAPPGTAETARPAPPPGRPAYYAPPRATPEIQPPPPTAAPPAATPAPQPTPQPPRLGDPLPGAPKPKRQIDDTF